MSTVRPGYNDLLTWCNKNGSRGQLLIEEWNQEKNYNEYGMPIVMQEISACTTRKKYYWKCKKCRKDFLMSPACRTLQNQGCPECSHRMGGIKNHRNAIENNNDLYSWCMENGIFGKKLITEWNARKNMDLLGVGIADVSCACRKKVYWVCSRCGKEFECEIWHRTAFRTGCRHCNKRGTSFPEQVIYMALKQIYQNTINRGKAFGAIEYDICIPEERMCIEYNGEYWHRNRAERDSMKTDICKQHNVRLFRIVANSTGVEWKISEDEIIYRVSYTNHLSQIYRIIEYIVNMLGHDMAEIDFEKAVDGAYRIIFDEVDNNIKVTHPELISEWDYENNGSMKPEYFIQGSHYRAKWKCKNCGYKWDVEIRSRIIFRTGCSECGYNVFDNKIHSSARNKPKTKKETVPFITFI